jgi:hypothetical protein
MNAKMTKEIMDAIDRDLQTMVNKYQTEMTLIFVCGFEDDGVILASCGTPKLNAFMDEKITGEKLPAPSCPSTERVQ